MTDSKITDTVIEDIAKSIHHRWMKKRISEGWVLGKERNDVLKTHPCLIPYEELSEIEKEYDRATARETIECLLELGYEIKKVP